MAERYLIAEYCEGPFYMGWWLYLRDRNDGSANDDGFDTWGWLRCHCWGGDDCNHCVVRSVFDLCVSMGETPIMPRRYSDKFPEWFAGRFPGGLKIETEGGWRVVEVVPKVPKQIKRGIIRTVARANRSFERACRKHVSAINTETAS